MSQGWIAVASAEHVRLGRTGGFMQVCHGKAAPLRRIQPGDAVVYYSPTTSFGGKDRLQAFTAIGIVRDGDPYAFDMGGGFCPFRREVAWLDAGPTPIAPLLEMLRFTAGKSNWGYQFRFGLLPIDMADVHCVAQAMGVSWPEALQGPESSRPTLAMPGPGAMRTSPARRVRTG